MLEMHLKGRKHEGCVRLDQVEKYITAIPKARITKLTLLM